MKKKLTAMLMSPLLLMGLMTTNASAGTATYPPVPPHGTPPSVLNICNAFGGNARAWSQGDPVSMEFWMRSANGRDSLMFQPDGNFVLYRDNKSVWNSHTANTGGNWYLSAQTDCNIVIYNGGHALWNTGTWQFKSTVRQIYLPGDGTWEVGEWNCCYSGVFDEYWGSEYNP